MNTTLDFTSGDAHHQIHITETDNDYQIQVGGVKTWTMPGPRSDSFLRHTIMVLEYNWQRGNVPDTSNDDEIFGVMKGMAEYQADEAIGELVKDGFPTDAVPVFRQFLIDEFAVHTGLAIGTFWKLKQQKRLKPDHIVDVTIEGVYCQLKITGSQGPEYEIEIVPVAPCDDPTGKTSALMLKVAGLDKCNFWTAKGPFDQGYRRSLIGILEDNWQRETLPTSDDQKAFQKVVRKLTNYYVDPIIYELKTAMFPADVLPVLRQLVAEDFSLTIVLTIGQFWKEKNETD